MVFQELGPAQSHKIKNRSDLESELFADSGNHAAQIRDNEGEAAEHGIYFDDSEYDYMQHVRDLDAGSGENYLLEAPPLNKQKKDKGKMSLEEALRGSSLGDEQSESAQSKVEDLLGEDMFASKTMRSTTYQDQQDVPDALAGFQPDMDPRLREVLIALEDDAYVDDEEDFFGEIAKDGSELTLDEFEESGPPEDEDEEDGWESDRTERPSRENQGSDALPPAPNVDVAMEDAPSHGDGDWMKEFSKFNQDKKFKQARPEVPTPDIQSSITTGTSMTGGRRKKRKGALTSSTGYSMTSSSLARTEGMTLLDARFDKIEEDYADDDTMDMDDGTASMVSHQSLASNNSVASSQAPSLVGGAFDNMMDDFLGGYSMSGKRRIKKGGYQSGMEQLDEVRRELGPAKVRTQKAG